ncbi:carbon-nitrogen hydrolase family protein [Nocardioides sp. JQ2195]|uniref:carbon-nitrogen hydrolase family protein n=1 Tax=Nocardioides sp. JQ2195 TaxID=2592334 RepID=UPI00143E49D9|nr:carbon-nitrogen hydrolase family protein [Nocardioides sp. JQ2195]QIX25820.1 carbon-nitrogen hydrolase family protein [Nocardioides sp. JQ2195]
MTLLVAAAQAASLDGDLPGNVARAAELVELAASQGARLVVLPEAFLTGYSEASFAADLPHEDSLGEPWSAPLRQAAADGDCVVVVSTPLQRATVKTLSLLVIRPSGEVSAPYDKQHLSGYERDHFLPGDHGASITVDGIELGLSICYDGCFPEHARAAAEDGAIGYLNSAAYFPGGEHRRDVYYPARAVENGMYVVFSGLTGRCGPSEFIGGSAVYDPEGRPLSRLGADPGIAFAEIDPELVHETRSQHPMLVEHRDTLGPRVRA